jgi:predicted DNA-binding transcriptional regulator AlpA
MVDDLIGTQDIAALLGVSRQRVDQLSRAYADFPAPRTTGRYRYWSRREVEKWIAAHPNRRPGGGVNR